jgi:ATP-binding cassette subfamily B protein
MVKFSISEFLSRTPPFDRLSVGAREKLLARSQLLRYRMGQVVLERSHIPQQIAIVYSGQIRLLGYYPPTAAPITLKLLGAGEIIGWTSLVRGVGCETAIASSEAICLVIPATDLRAIVDAEPSLADALIRRSSLIEVFDLLSTALEARADSEVLLKNLGAQDLKALAIQAEPTVAVHHLRGGKNADTQLDRDLTWLVSGGAIANYPVGSQILPTAASFKIDNPKGARLLGFPSDLFSLSPALASSPIQDTPIDAIADIPYAPDEPPSSEPPRQRQKYPDIRGRGPVDATLACFQMLAQYFQIPYRRDVIRRVLVNQQQRAGNLSLSLGGVVAELMGLKATLVHLPAGAIERLPTPALIAWQDSFAIIYSIGVKEVIIAIPETGIRRQKTSTFLDTWGVGKDDPEKGAEFLLLQPTRDTPKRKFGISWFLPALRRHSRVLTEVLIASLFVQLFGLANPLITQLIIDKVIIQKSLETLNTLGILLIIVAIFEAIINTLRTNLFVDTTNRIDLSLGSEIIDRLFRLPLRFFEKRPVGELATRINELENIRQFLTGTALTVVLDAVFSIIYIAAMLIYSWLLTVVALATLPLFILLTIVFAPLVRQQLRTKAERNAETQSYLVEVLGGIQTVKAQSIELRSRWQWQERYARYVSAGFNNAITATTASSLRDFLNKLSGLLLLWVGAYLVLQGQLSLGQLIAFRIIAGYTTNPLLRLVQLWQNFQETALSLERLGDIIDAQPEVDEANRNNIPMPAIAGAVRYESVSFRFTNSVAPQLNNINLNLQAGMFVGIVGQSGSGKSTLMKLMARLYEPESGRILLDNYDISKVELYSLRRQIGMVLQDTLLFAGTVQENIALTNPDATSEEIIEAARIAVAHDFIMELPNGYNTQVGERGSALSGGQRQRIAIARTVLQNSQLLILDEATSALDYDTERQVCLNLAAAFKGRTVFFITHRLATIQQADLILMMAQGAVVEQGTHAELMNLQGRYYCLYQQQASLEI